MEIPNRTYWSAQEQRADAIGNLAASACWLAFVAAFVVGLICF